MPIWSTLDLLEISDQEFGKPFASFTLGRVVEFDFALLEIAENLSYVRYIIYGQNELATKFAETLGEHFEVLIREIEPIEIFAPIRRIKVEERLGPVVPLEHLFIRQRFYLDPRQAKMCVGDDFLNARRIEVGRPGDRVTVGASPNQTGKCIFLKIEESCRALDIGQRRRILGFEQREQLPARQRELQIANVPVHLSTKEFDLLSVLVRHTGQIVTKLHLTKEAWGSEYADTLNSVKMYVHYLRLKIEKDPEHPKYILTSHRIGYRFQAS